MSANLNTWFESTARLHEQNITGLFHKYGINAPVTGENLANAVIYFGDDFAEDLSKFANTLSSAQGGEEPKSKFIDFVKKAAAIVTGVDKMAERQKQIRKESDPVNKNLDTEDNRLIPGISNGLLGLIVVAIVLLIVWYALRRKAG